MANYLSSYAFCLHLSHWRMLLLLISFHFHLSVLSCTLSVVSLSLSLCLSLPSLFFFSCVCNVTHFWLVPSSQQIFMSVEFEFGFGFLRLIHHSVIQNSNSYINIDVHIWAYVCIFISSQTSKWNFQSFLYACIYYHMPQLCDFAHTYNTLCVVTKTADTCEFGWS